MTFLLLATAPVFLTCAAFQDLRIEAFNKLLSCESLFKPLNFAPKPPERGKFYLFIRPEINAQASTEDTFSCESAVAAGTYCCKTVFISSAQFYKPRISAAWKKRVDSLGKDWK